MFSKDLIDTDFDYKFGVGLSYSSLSSFFGDDATEKSENQAFRTYNFSDGDFDTSFTVLGNVKYEYVEFHNRYNGKFKLSENLIGGLGLDMSYYSLDQKFTYNDTLRDDKGEIIKDNFGNVQSQKKTVDDQGYSTFRLMYLMPNLEYYFIDDKINKLLATLEAQIPFSFDERTELNDGIFLDDGYFQLYTGIDYKLISKNTTLEFGGGYLMRNEIYNNLLRADLGIYFTRIENTYFFAKATYLHSMEDKNDFKFQATEFATN